MQSATMRINWMTSTVGLIVSLTVISWIGAARPVSAVAQLNCTMAVNVGCKCLAHDGDITCVDTSMDRVPTNLAADPSAVRGLTIRGNTFAGGVLKGPIVYVGLTVLHLDSDGIHRVVPGVFGNLSSLHSLSLANNLLRSLEPGTFDGLRSLTILDLADNQLYWLDVGVLSDKAVPALMTLDLVRCRINDIEVGALANLHQLTVINITANRMERLPELGPGLTSLTLMDISSNRLHGHLDGSAALSGMPSVQRLYLANNDITRLTNTSLCPVDHKNCGHKLTELVLRNNRLSYVERGAWASLRSIERLDLSFNMLTELNPDDLPFDSLTKLLIHDNPWNCSDCLNSWIVEEDAAKLSNVETNVRCFSPESLAGADVYTDEVFAECSTTPRAGGGGGGGGRTALLVISSLLLLVVSAVAVLCLCRRRARQRRRPTLHTQASPSRAVGRPRPAAVGVDESGAFSYRQMVDMDPVPTVGSTSVLDVN